MSQLIFESVQILYEFRRQLTWERICFVGESAFIINLLKSAGKVSPINCTTERCCVGIVISRVIVNVKHFKSMAELTCEVADGISRVMSMTCIETSDEISVIHRVDVVDNILGR